MAGWRTTSRDASLGALDGGILLNEHIAEDGVIAFDHTCKPGADVTVSKRIDLPYRSRHQVCVCLALLTATCFRHFMQRQLRA